MNLYLVYASEEDPQKVVYSTSVNGRVYFFYSGFASAEEAIAATKELHVRLKSKDCKNTPTSMVECWVETSLTGEWKCIK